MDECSIISEEVVIDWDRVNDLLAKCGAPKGGWKGGILLIDLPKEPYQNPTTDKGIFNAKL